MSYLDEIHEQLEVIEETIARLNQDGRDYISVDEYPEFCLAVNDALGYGSAYGDDVAKKLGIAPATLTKFAKFRGKVSLRTAKIVADRMRSYVRSLDQRTSSNFFSPVAVVTTTPPPPSTLSFPAEHWKLASISSEMTVRIAAVSSLLEAIVTRLKKTNYPPEEQAITDIERAQLIAVLETALAVLNSPMKEKSILKKAQEGLTKAAQKAGEKQVEQGIGNAAQQAATQLFEIIKNMF